MSIFYTFILLLAVQRICELVIAKRNEQWMKKRGAREYGQRHYHFIVLIHVLFFVVYFLEVTAGDKELTPVWPFLLSLFALTQLVRIWAITSLGKYWNTRIIVLPGATLVKKGPYRFMRHPNYLVVSLEFLIIPLLFEAYMTAIIFTLMNFLILSIRIPAEEKALKAVTDYDSTFIQSKS
ncbi:isoprenylcysteine carboxyl methyltransferase family protein [Bacillus benzoevorans]|uniref:Methyltransferase n=1 Tax=Bacillus benzoevorans TaxID=1456 RepID=A0A7X0LVI9_9BACI|nr:isoprenylcysteine carboxylmethyltransferase family protein [Bacillus benzoevorans]MBB6444329.1 methyltransferase [Bacillus benzoevorans]